MKTKTLWMTIQIGAVAIGVVGTQGCDEEEGAVDIAPLDAGAGGTVPLPIDAAAPVVPDVDAAPADAPAAFSAVADKATTTRDVAILINVTANDVGVPLNALVSLSEPLNGSVSVRPDGWLKYVPKKGWDGADSFSYTVRSSDGRVAVGTVGVKVLPTAGTAAGGVLYAATAFRPDKGSGTWYGVSAAGDLVGELGNGTSGIRKANGQTVQITPPAPLEDSNMYAFNGSGEAVGWGWSKTNYSGEYSFLWKDGVATLWPEANYAAKGINEAGTVVGEFNDVDNNYKGYAFTRTRAGVFEKFSMTGALDTRASGIDSQGAVVGRYIPDLGGGKPGPTTCFRRQADKSFTALPPPPAFVFTDMECTGVNDMGVISGFFRRSTEVQRWRALRRDSDGTIAVVPFPFPRAYGAYGRNEFLMALNNAGTLVGYYYEKEPVEVNGKEVYRQASYGVRLEPVALEPGTRPEDSTFDHVDGP